MDSSNSIDLTNRESFGHWSLITIRYGDQDAMGHVNNVSIGSYMEVSRTMLIQDIVDRFDYPDLDFILAQVVIDYHQEFHYPGVVDVGGRLLRVGNKSLRSGYGLFMGETCLATSEAVNVFFDMKTRKSVAPPEDLRAALVAELKD